MRIKFLGAAGMVTGSSYVLTSNSGQSILVDLGMFQGTEEIEALNYEKYDFDVSKLLGAVLTHAHLDHCGRLPILIKGGFKGSIWMTPATSDLTALSLIDSAKIAKQDKTHSLYDEEEAFRTIDRFATVGYKKPINVGDFSVTFRDAGHILGSASLEIEDKSSSSLGIKKIVFSGDLGNTPEELVCPTELIDTSDVVVMESTYGDRMHPKEDARETIRTEINMIEDAKSTLLMPAFSLERSQELMHTIKHLKIEGKIKNDTPVYLDAPMAEKATAIYMNYPDIFNDHVKDEMKEEGPFDFPGLQVVGSHRESERLRGLGGPKVIIAGSGMMVGGRIVGHAAYFLPMESTRLLIVGYQGEGTLGRKLMEGEKNVVIDGKEVIVKASVKVTLAMSSHAGQDQLMSWLGHISGVKRVFLTHGEDTSRHALSDKIKQELKIENVDTPALNQEVVF